MPGYTADNKYQMSCTGNFWKKRGRNSSSKSERNSRKNSEVFLMETSKKFTEKLQKRSRMNLRRIFVGAPHKLQEEPRKKLLEEHWKKSFWMNTMEKYVEEFQIEPWKKCQEYFWRNSRRIVWISFQRIYMLSFRILKGSYIVILERNSDSTPKEKTEWGMLEI